MQYEKDTHSQIYCVFLDNIIIKTLRKQNTFNIYIKYHCPKEVPYGEMIKMFHSHLLSLNLRCFL
jgi:hypothetical protein